jgi:hypothetical protein
VSGQPPDRPLASEPETFTIRGAAERCGVSYQAIRKRVDRGSIGVVKRRGVRLVPRSELERVGLWPSGAPAAQRELERLREENRHLVAELAALEQPPAPGPFQPWRGDAEPFSGEQPSQLPAPPEPLDAPTPLEPPAPPELFDAPTPAEPLGPPEPLDAPVPAEPLGPPEPLDAPVPAEPPPAEPTVDPFPDHEEEEEEEEEVAPALPQQGEPLPLTDLTVEAPAAPEPPTPHAAEPPPTAPRDAPSAPPPQPEGVEAIEGSPAVYPEAAPSPPAETEAAGPPGALREPSAEPPAETPTHPAAPAPAEGPPAVPAEPPPAEPSPAEPAPPAPPRRPGRGARARRRLGRAWALAADPRLALVLGLLIYVLAVAAAPIYRPLPSVPFAVLLVLFVVPLNLGAALAIGQRWASLLALAAYVALLLIGLVGATALALALVVAATGVLVLGVYLREMLDRARLARRRRRPPPPLVLAGPLLALALIPAAWGLWLEAFPSERLSEQPARLDERAGGFRGVGLGDSTAVVRRAYGFTRPRRAPIEPELEALGAPVRAARSTAAYRYPGAIVLVDADRVAALVITDRNAETASGVGVGDGLARARATYPGMRCGGQVSRSGVLAVPYCTAPMGSNHYLRFGQDPIASITLAPVERR